MGKQSVSPIDVCESMDLKWLKNGIWKSII